MEAMFLAGLIVGFVLALVAVSLGIIYQSIVKFVRWKEPEPVASEQEEWERAYDQAMQSRDWQSCEILIEERDMSDWYVPEEADSNG